MNYWSHVGIPNVKRKENVFDNVCRVFELTSIELRSRKRFRKIVDGKTALCYILHRKCGLTSTEVAAFMKLNHATILHHCKKAEGLIETDKEYLSKLKQLNIIL